MSEKNSRNEVSRSDLSGFLKILKAFEGNILSLAYLWQQQIIGLFLYR